MFLSKAEIRPPSGTCQKQPFAFSGMAYREDRHILELSFQPTLVGLTAWYSQLVATFLLTLLITLAVWRSRRTLLNQVEAEVVRADLARYVSPDVAEAPTRHGETALRLPISRIDSQDRQHRRRVSFCQTQESARDPTDDGAA
jgi:hypothetical protein